VSSGTEVPVFTSSDGLAWAPVPAPPFDPLWAQRMGGFQGIAVGRDGTLLAYGGLTPELWASDDGRTWGPIQGAMPFPAGGLSSIVATDGGFVAVGYGSGRGSVWRSADGRTWTREPPHADFEDADLGAVFVCGETLFVSGHVIRNRWVADPAAWALPGGAAGSRRSGRRPRCSGRQA